VSDADKKSDVIPRRGRLVGVDYGSVRIGLALCDEEQTIAGPLAGYARRTRELDAAYFRDLAQQERIVGFVVGLPLHLSGRDSQKSREVETFARWLTEVTGLPVTFYDERFSSAAADEAFGGELTRKQRKARRDKIAAQIILAGFLESGRRSDWQQSID
jgi:putative Holliday junction resolvase